MHLIRQMELYSVIKLDPSAPDPTPPDQTNFWTISRTVDELSLVCETNAAPQKGILAREDDWVVFRVAGTMEFSLTGIVSRISQPIATAEIGIFVISTFDTDYILIKSDQAHQAVNVWREAHVGVIEPVQQTERLLLVRLANELDHVAANNRSHRLWVSDYPSESDLLISHLAQEAGEAIGLFQLRIKSTGEAIGGIGFKAEHEINGHLATEIGYGLAQSMCGYGYGAEAVSGLIHIARAQGITHLCAETNPINEASQNVLQKNNFVESSRSADSIWWLLTL